MSSNIVFESNVYPVWGSITSDQKFLSQVWDYNRIRHIDQKWFHGINWPKLQGTILREQPYCALNKDDPCWGMVKTQKGYRWVCMCMKEECGYFSDCRKAIPYDAEAESVFLPLNDDEDEYGYKKFLAEYSPHQVLVGDSSEYGSAEEKKQCGTDVKMAPSLIFKKLLSEKPTTAVVSAIGDENLIEEEIGKAVGFESTVSDKKDSYIEDSRVVEESQQQQITVDKLDINSPALNVFDFFEECTQQEIIEGSSKESFFVDAGPGTGKTFTLIQKLNYLVNEEGVEADGILVLCFTNAAVDEIKTRLKQFVEKGADRSLINVDVRTFHSFAWWLINQANTALSGLGWSPINMHNLTYETSLVSASYIVSRFGKEVVGNWEYFIVDEVQDLTNTLGRFVLKIVSACLSTQCGVTVLGDACQAIYDYDQETRSIPMKSAEFYKALFRQMYGKARFVSLTENHRQGERLIALTSGLREAILSADQSQMKAAVDVFFEKVDKTTETGARITNEYINRLRNGGSISLLLRNNGQTLKMSSDLRKRGVAHTLNITETKNNFALWIADVFSDYTKMTISEDVFEELYEKHTGLRSNNVWYRLQRLLHTDNDVLNVKDLLNAIAVSKIDDPILRSTKSKDVVVSNIHRAKGREYDNVLVDRSFVESFSETSPEDEYKTLYVAITRPKQRIYISPLQERSGMKIIQIFATGRKRWGKTKDRKIAYLEFDSSKDLSPDWFVMASSKFLSEVEVGDAVSLVRKINGKSISYSIYHENTETNIGQIGLQSAFIQDVKEYLKLDASSWIEMPAVIDDLYVSGIYSQVVDKEYLDTHPEIREVAPNGVWKWVELIGIGHMEYDVY